LQAALAGARRGLPALLLPALVHAQVLQSDETLAAGSTAEQGLADPGSDIQHRGSVHAQLTSVIQYHPRFEAAYSGANSLESGAQGKETNDLTLYAGLRLWEGAAAYVNPEVDQGYGLSDTLGVAGFPSGEAYKIGRRNPYFRLPRAFVRQVFALDDAQASSAIADDANQLAEQRPDDNVTVTVGKFSVVDVFDANRYAHDPRGDFLNWSVIDAGAFDYAADAWGFTYGAAVEWTQSRWTGRLGFFALSQVPNSPDIDGQFHQFSAIAELEERHQVGSFGGKVKLLAFDNEGRMGTYDAAIELARQAGGAPSTTLVRQYASRPGAALNLEQELASDMGAFLRASANDGKQEAFDFTDINKSFAAGWSMQGGRWGRAEDSAGIALVVNGLSADAQRYFAAGGLGIVIGDGSLDYGLEKIAEAFYSLHAARHLTLSGDFQYVVHPAYNRDRGPVPILALRLHAEL
jgi:high affinity Mn2+ porin